MQKYPDSIDEWRNFKVNQSDATLLIGGWQVMQRWELPLMKKLARSANQTGGHILEVGFGMGISANEIIKIGCKTYTVIEAHPVIAENARAWSKTKKTKIKVIEGFWENVVSKLISSKTKFDGILFDTYPLSQELRSKNHYPFIPYAKQLLKKNGVFTCYSDETSSFRADHLKILLENFNHVELVKVSNLRPPLSCEYWKHDYMIIPVARNTQDE